MLCWQWYTWNKCLVITITMFKMMGVVMRYYLCPSACKFWWEHCFILFSLVSQLVRKIIWIAQLFLMFSSHHGEVKHSLKTMAKENLSDIKLATEFSFHLTPSYICFMSGSSSNLGNHACSCSWDMCQWTRKQMRNQIVQYLNTFWVYIYTPVCILTIFGNSLNVLFF